MVQPDGIPLAPRGHALCVPAFIINVPVELTPETQFLKQLSILEDFCVYDLIASLLARHLIELIFLQLKNIPTQHS